jgi:hypothetical protein
MSFLSTINAEKNLERITISILASVCHGEKTGSGMLELAVEYARDVRISKCTAQTSTHKFSSGKRSP